MTRVKGGSIARKRRNKLLKEAKGFFGSKHRLFKTAKEQWMKSRVYAYRDRKQRKRMFRKLWITRINAACRENNISYSKFINGLNKAGLLINRKMLAEIAIDSPEAFNDLVMIALTNLDGQDNKVVNSNNQDQNKIKNNSKKKESKEKTAVKTIKKPATLKSKTPKASASAKVIKKTATLKSKSQKKDSVKPIKKEEKKRLKNN